ncbi:hypothetical protein GCM10012284_15690 [Mangrovihabitans endophyticus]|uniref:CDP-diglyceride synthetase n=2 Tax=Mangrovihabitans endophyticus TaxID=1751298 RepID=A0A8J3FME5_9ACTN|nr:hypothetical protein GCM10012284_15690 [Mangrovihabitans endophyticus]
MPQDGERDPWGPDRSREIAKSAPGRATFAERSSGHGGDADREDPELVEDEIEVVAVRRSLSLAIAGFAGLLAFGLVVGAQTTGPDARTSYAAVIFGIQALFLFAWMTATRPPAAPVITGIGAVVGLLTVYIAATSASVSLLSLFWVALAGLFAAVVAQLVRAGDRHRIRESFGNTAAVVFGVAAFAMLVLLTRKPTGTQSLLVCVSTAGLAVLLARLADAVYPKPRLAPQVPRGGIGVVLGAMVGTLGASALGSVLVLPFTPAKGAVLGLVAAGVAVVADLGVNYSEAAREEDTETPTFWVARHLQGPLAAFAVVAPVAYAMTTFYLT